MSSRKERKELRTGVAKILKSGVKLSRKDRNKLKKFLKPESQIRTNTVKTILENNSEARIVFPTNVSNRASNAIVGIAGNQYVLNDRYDNEILNTVGDVRPILDKARVKDKLKVQMIINNIVVESGENLNGTIMTETIEIPSAVFTSKKDLGTFATSKIWGEVIYEFINRIIDEQGAIFELNADIRLQLIRPFRLTELKEIKQFFKRGLYNCVLSAIRDLKGVKGHIVDKLNKKFFDSGVSYDDIPYICKRVDRGIRVLDAMGNPLYEYVVGKKKTVEVVNDTIDHVVEASVYLFDHWSEKDVVIRTQEEIDDILKNKENPLYGKLKVVSDGMLEFVDFVIATEEAKRKKELAQAYFDKFHANEYLVKGTKLFDFSNASVRYPSAYFNNFEEAIQDYDNLVALDKNKAFGAYKENRFYEECKFPNSLHGPYENNGIPADKIIAKAGLSRIYDLDISGTGSLKEYFENINFVENDIIYPHNYLSALWSYGVRFSISHTAIGNGKRDITLTEEEIKMKMYQLYYGMGLSSKDCKTREIHGGSDIVGNFAYGLQEIGDIEVVAYKTVYSEEGSKMEHFDREYLVTWKDGREERLDISQKEVEKLYKRRKITYFQAVDKKPNHLCVMEKKKTVKNLSHLSSYMIGYTLIEVLDKLRELDFSEVYKLRCDSITTLKKNVGVFNVGTGMGDWKIEKVKDYIYQCDKYLASRVIKVGKCYGLTERKLRWGRVNMICGAAGTGKSSQFWTPFDEDNRLTDCLFLFPSHVLREMAESSYKINTDTIQKFLYTGFDKSAAFNEYKKIRNIVVDESSMVSVKDIKKMVKLCKKHNWNVYFISDCGLKRVFQLKPVEGKTANYRQFKQVCDHIERLTKVHRNGGELLRRLNIIRKKDLSNSEILEMFSDRVIDEATLYKKYKVSMDNSILSSVNRVVAKYNVEIFSRNDKVISKDRKTDLAKGTIKNKRRMVDKEVIELPDQTTENYHKEVNKTLAYAMTAHLCQGMTYKGKVFIHAENLFTENLLYVMLSRAESLENVFIIKG